MKLRSSWMIGLAAWLAAALIWVWLRTVRAQVRSNDRRVYPPNPDADRFIYAFWHESLLAPAKIKTRVKIMISQSADGELIARVCSHLGIGVVRGSTTRGGAMGLLDLLREGENSHLALTPDGPRGPRRRVQPGLVFLASHSGFSIVPVGIGFTRAWRAKSWDRFAIPRPFSTVTAVLAEPIVIPSDLDGNGLERYRVQAEESLLGATQAAERWAEALRNGLRHAAGVSASAAAEPSDHQVQGA